MIEFAGFSLPIAYGSQLDEHHTVRQDAGVFDVSHMNIVDISGAQAQDFMQVLMANDVAKLSTAYQALYTCMLNKTGGVIDDLIVYFINPQSYRLVVNATTGQKDIAHMQQVGQNFDITITHQTDLAMIAIQGPNAITKFNQAMPGTTDMVKALKPFTATEIGRLFIARTGYTGEDGLEVMLPAKSAGFTWQMLLDAGITPCGLGARDTLRLEAGMSLYGNEMDEDTSPLDAGLAWTVDLSNKNRDFIGRDALGEKQRDLVGLILTNKGIMRHGQVVKTSLGQGVITSGGFSPSMQKSIALARLPVGSVKLKNVQVQIREKWCDAQLVRPNFVRKGKVIVNID